MTDVSSSPALSLAVGEWKLDPAHSGVHFKVRHLGPDQRARHVQVLRRHPRPSATRSTAWLWLPSSTWLPSTPTIPTATPTSSAPTSSPPRRTRRSRSHPLASSAREDELELTGELTINGITRAVSFPVEFNGVEVHPADGKHHAGFSAVTVINRNDFGVDFNMPLGMNKLALGEKVNVELELQFVTD